MELDKFISETIKQLIDGIKESNIRGLPELVKRLNLILKLPQPKEHKKVGELEFLSLFWGWAAKVNPVLRIGL